MTSLIRKSPTTGRIRASVIVSAAALLPVALLTQADPAAAQIPDPPTIYHSFDPEGADPRDEWLPGTTPGDPGDTGGPPDSGYGDSGYYDSGAPDPVGGWVTVVGDLNADVGNDTFYDNLMESGRHMLASRGTNFGVDGIIANCDSVFNFDCSVEVTNTTITEQKLAGVDLLLFNQIGDGFDVPLSYTPAELTAIANFVANGGNVLLVAESDNFTQSYSDFLTGIGSTIQFTGGRFGNPHDIASSAPFMDGVDSFVAEFYNTLSGGTTLVFDTVDTGNPAFVATQQLGGVPPSEYECVLNGTSYEELSLWIYGGDTASATPGETLCKKDETGDPGGSGGEICGAAITLQVQGVGRFRKFVPDPGMDTLVLGSDCIPNGGAACILPINPPLKQLKLNFRRGASDPQAIRRRIGSLIVDSTGLDPASNYSLISGFGDIATANLLMLGIASGEEPQTLADSRACPEPAELVQMLSGLFGLAGLNRLRRRR